MGDTNVARNNTNSSKSNDIGMPSSVSLGVSVISSGQYAILDGAGYSKVAKWGGIYTDVTIGLVDVTSAYRRGTVKDVVVQTSGVGGSIGGGIVGGALAGATAGFFTGFPPAVVGAAFLGGVAGGIVGENGAESIVSGLLGDYTEVYGLNSEAFWNRSIQKVESTSMSPAVKAAILADFVRARSIPSFRDEIAEKYGLVSYSHCFPSDALIPISEPDPKLS